MAKISIGIDFDSTIAQMDELWLGRFNALKGTDYQISDWKDWELSFLRPDDRPLFFSLLTPDLYDAVLPYELASEVIHGWSSISEYSLVCVTTNPSVNSDEFTAAKLRWLQRHVPELSGNLVATRTKNGLGLDILIDDGPHNHTNGDFISVLVERPWNQNFACDHSFESWKDADYALQSAITQLTLNQKKAQT